MTTHLSTQEFVDAVDLALPSVRQTHLKECQACQAEVDALRGAVNTANLDAEIPEPSPLFWEHFQARVRAEVRAEAEPSGARSWLAGVTSGHAFLAASAAVAVMALGVSLYTGGVDRLSPVAGGEFNDVALLDDGTAAFDQNEWEFVTDVIGTLEPGDVRDVLAPSRHALDAVFETLTEGERKAFMALLAAEMTEGTE